MPVTAIAFSILRAVGSLDAESRLLAVRRRARCSRSMADVTDRIPSSPSKVSIGALGGGGLLFTLVTCYSLYSYVERIFNDIWRVGERRTLHRQVPDLLRHGDAAADAGGFSLYWSGKLIGVGAVARASSRRCGIEIVALP